MPFTSSSDTADKSSMELPTRFLRQQLFHLDVLDLPEEFDGQIGLTVTAPPGVEDDYPCYLRWSERWLKRLYRLTKRSGRFCLSIPLDVKDQNGPKPLMADLIERAQKVGWSYRGTILWRTSSPRNRTIIVFYKHHWPNCGDLTPQEAKRWSHVWRFQSESAKRVDHPDPCPLELPRRCIRQFSNIEDIVLDPFVGSGSTLIAAQALDREGLGCDVDARHVRTALDRLQREWQELQQSWTEEVARWGEDDQGRDLIRDYIDRKEDAKIPIEIRSKSD